MQSTHREGLFLPCIPRGAFQVCSSWSSLHSSEPEQQGVLWGYLLLLSLQTQSSCDLLLVNLIPSHRLWGAPKEQAAKYSCRFCVVSVAAACHLVTAVCKEKLWELHLAAPPLCVPLLAHGHKHVPVLNETSPPEFNCLLLKNKCCVAL